MCCLFISLSDLRPIGMTRTQENIEMKRTPSTENLDCVLAHLLECSPLMREPACSMPQSYPCLLQSRQKRSEAAALNMYKWHWLQSEGKSGRRSYHLWRQAKQQFPLLLTNRQIFVFFRTRMLTRAFRSVSTSSGGRIDLATLVGSQSLRVPHRSTGRIWCK